MKIQARTSIYTLRRSRVSEAIRPLLGKPRRTSLRSADRLSTFPFTTVTGDASEQHMTVNLIEDLQAFAGAEAENEEDREVERGEMDEEH